MTDQSKDTTKVQLGERVSFIGITGTVAEQLLTGTEVTLGGPPKAHPSMSDHSEAGNPEHTVQLEGSWRELLSGGCFS